MARKELSSLLNGKIQFISTENSYKPSIDAVLLASAVDAKQSDTVLDIGIGSGAVSLCLLNRCPNLIISGIDISEDMLNETKLNMKLNNKHIDLKRQDIMTWITKDTFDIVMTNPPFFKGTSAAKQKIAIAHNEDNMRKWIKQSIKRVKPRGYFYCISDVNHLAIIIEVLSKQKMGEITIYPIYSFVNKSAERVIISARLGVNTPSKIIKPIVIHNLDGSYTKTADKILKDGEFLMNL